MGVVHLVGPNGAPFQWEEPLPGFIQRWIDAGQVTVVEKPKRAAKAEKPAKAGEE